MIPNSSSNVDGTARYRAKDSRLIQTISLITPLGRVGNKSLGDARRTIHRFLSFRNLHGPSYYVARSLTSRPVVHAPLLSNFPKTSHGDGSPMFTMLALTLITDVFICFSVRHPGHALHI